jgi:hypothetical protein
MAATEGPRGREPLQALPMAQANKSQRPVSPGPGLLKRRVSDAIKPQRNMLSAPAQRLATRQVHMVIQREKPPTFATRVKDGIFIGTVHAALDPGFIFVRVMRHTTEHAPRPIRSPFPHPCLPKRLPAQCARLSDTRRRAASRLAWLPRTDE